MKRIIEWASGINLWVWLAIAALVASGWGYSAFLSRQVSEARKDVKALSEALSASESENEKLRVIRKADEAATASRDKAVAVIEQKEAKRREETEKALAENPDWSNSPVPQSVLDSLRR